MSEPLATYSIVACDLDAGQWGVAVASKFLAVGAAVPAARWDVGAVATQAWANLAYRPQGLELLAEGRTAADVVEALTGKDDGREHRQLGVVDPVTALAARGGAVDEPDPVEHGEVPGHRLARDRQLLAEGRSRPLTVDEQEVEHPAPRRVSDRGPQRVVDDGRHDATPTVGA